MSIKKRYGLAFNFDNGFIGSSFCQSWMSNFLVVWIQVLYYWTKKDETENG